MPLKEKWKDAGKDTGEAFGNFGKSVGKTASVVFTDEKNETGEYAKYKYYGYEWNEAEDVTESDVIADKHGNGWFMWTLDKADLMELHLMSNKGAVDPKNYTVTKLTDTDLQFKDEFDVSHKYVKVVSKK